jgi:chemotaxis protein methyltransferase CheR
MVTQASEARKQGAGTNARRMSDKEFRRFSELIQGQCGIKLPPTKKTMLEARLQKRLRVLNMIEFREYGDYLFSTSGLSTELPHLLDVITTNTTNFFREPKHYDILMSRVLPQWHESFGNKRPLRLWSAGCSTGEEPYTLTMVLLDYQDQHPDFRFQILATDISNKVLEHAVKGIYTEDKVDIVPMHYKKRYMLRSKDRTRRLVRISPDVRKHITFARLNFMEEFTLDESKDIIFCRNVLIYFERPTQERLIRRFCDVLLPGGHLFIGHSESLTGMQLPLRQIAPTVYEKI